MTDEPKHDRRREDIARTRFERHVNDHLDEIKVQMQGFAERENETQRRLAQVEKDEKNHELAISENTELTRTNGERVIKLVADVQPMIDVIASARNGLIKLQRISDWFDRWGRRGMKIAIWTIAVYAAARLLMHGGTVAEALEVFWHSVK